MLYITSYLAYTYSSSVTVQNTEYIYVDKIHFPTTSTIDSEHPPICKLLSDHAVWQYINPRDSFIFLIQSSNLSNNRREVILHKESLCVHLSTRRDGIWLKYGGTEHCPGSRKHLESPK